jgi:multisubunit Na+/H+ antiporter MnhB subunit
MSEKYKVGITTKLNHPAHAQHAHAQRVTSGSQMNKVTDTLLDVTKVAVVGGVAIGTIAAAGALLKK